MTMTNYKIRSKTIEHISIVIVEAGQQIHGTASQSVRADSFVVETNIHYPTESSLIWDGVRKFVPLCVELAAFLGIDGWQQSKHLRRKIKQLVRNIFRVSASNNAHKKDALKSLYSDLLQRVESLILRAKILHETAQIEGNSSESFVFAKESQRWIELTEQVCDTARRRVLFGKTVPNSEKLLSSSFALMLRVRSGIPAV